MNSICVGAPCVCRTKNKQKFESLEQEVHAMSDHLRSLERQKAELTAQIQKLQPQTLGQTPPKPCLPDIDKASHSKQIRSLFKVKG